MKFMDMFFGFNNPLCMEAEYNELRNLVLYPEPTNTLTQNNISFVKSGPDNNAHGKSQGGDFIF